MENKSARADYSDGKEQEINIEHIFCFVNRESGISGENEYRACGLVAVMVDAGDEHRLVREIIPVVDRHGIILYGMNKEV
jgi:hypothetical protein